MKYTAIAETDVGNTKETNQDSVLIKHASFDGGEVLMAIICDGMGGLSKGEVASGSVVNAFSKWFDEELPFELENYDAKVICGKWILMLKTMNSHLLEYGKLMRESLGTTFTGILFVNNEYLIVHVGDTCAYLIDSAVNQLTQDQTYIAREISKGTMTLEEAKKDRKRNMLLQCVGASKNVEPEVLYGTVSKGVYMLCSDGFRHVINEKEMYESLNPVNLMNKRAMHSNARYLIDLIKSRDEKDNISVVLIKVD